MGFDPETDTHRYFYAKHIAKGRVKHLAKRNATGCNEGSVRPAQFEELANAGDNDMTMTHSEKVVTRS